MSRILTLFVVVLLVASSLVLVGSVSAQSSPKPSVPEFTLKYIDNSYDVPAKSSSSTDPYTGKTSTTTIPGYHVDNKTIQIVIKNQNVPINQYLYYNYSYKGHYEENWKYYRTGSYPWDSSGPTFNHQSTSDHTIITYNSPKEGQLDFRVQAQIGYYNETKAYVPVPGAPFSEYTFIGEVSGWSNAQTIEIPARITVTPTAQPSTSISTTVPSVSSNHTEKTQDSQLTWLTIGVVVGLGVVVALLVVVVGFMRRRIRVLEHKLEP